MKKLVSIILVLTICYCFVLSSFAASNDQFVFRDGITWGMTVSEVEQHEKNINKTYLSNDESVYSALGYANIEVSSYPYANLYYIFKDGLLYGAIYDPAGADTGTITYLKNAMHSKYGDSDSWGKSEIVKLFSYFYGILYLIEGGDTFEQLFINAGVDNIDDFIEFIEVSWSKISKEQEAELSQLGEVWRLSDGTTVILSDEKAIGYTFLFYLAPEMNQYNTNGL